jgi:serine protease Do
VAEGGKLAFVVAGGRGFLRRRLISTTFSLLAFATLCGTHLSAQGDAATADVPAAIRSASDRTFQTAIDAVQPRVVKIFGAGGIANLASYGSGFLVSPQGHIVTVWSHVLHGEVVAVVLHDGNVFKVATGDEPVSVMHGVVAARTRLTARRGRFEVPYDGPVYIVDAVTNNSGAAGGVLTTQDGRLLAMLGRELRDADNNLWINYAIPISELAGPISAIIEGREIERETPVAENATTGYIPTDFGLILVPDAVYRTPAFIDQIVPGSLLDGHGLLPDDLVVFVNDELVHSIRTLESQLARLQAEDDLTLIVRRGNQLIPVQVIVPRKEEP